MACPPELKLKIQILSGDEIAMGPGKADLLDAIAQAGSISGAARTMGMSYRRAWLLVDAMNRCWAEPLVRAGPGRAGKEGNGGARLTAMGQDVLAQYRALQAEAAASAEPGWAGLHPLLLSEPRPVKE